MLNTEKLDRLQKRLEFWDRPGNPVTVNTGLELVALARKGLEAERLETLANGYKVASEEAQEIMAELRAEAERLEREAQWLAQAAANNGWQGVRVSPAFIREQARKAVEASHAE